MASHESLKYLLPFEIFPLLVWSPKLVVVNSSMISMNFRDYYVQTGGMYDGRGAPVGLVLI